MKKLFESSAINSMKLSNRFVRSATYEGMAKPDGTNTKALTNKMVELAEGEVGLIITSHAFISPEGRARPLQLGIYSDAMIPALAAMTEAVHKKKGAIAIQLAHAGILGDAKASGLDPIGPSAFERPDKVQAKEIPASEITRLLEAYAAAAERAKKAGFDAIQIHSAHGYLLSQFLSPYFNKRKDGYGGSLENRSRLLREVVAAIRSKVGKGYPILVKLNSEDFLSGGLSREEAMKVCVLLEQAGVDAVELSGGTGYSPDRIPSRKGFLKTENDEVYYREAAEAYKKEVKIPLILVGGIRTYSVAEKILDEGLADYVALSRPLIREPHIIKRWGAGDRSRMTCLSCNLCYQPILAGKGIYCEVDAKAKAEN